MCMCFLVSQEGDTALIRAILSSQQKVVEILQAYKADINTQNQVLVQD